ncbi:coilin isoform X2 [Ischnura elegans]|uniref:coilin isoform X2 n=1 Tax=Ischnura elegans TaxID=197161 RepID=UPI001ED8AAEE|nr:coilin isoform X2 [Ischnura elegans]
MAGRRVVVDLSAFFLDHRRKSLIYVDHTVSCVQNLIDHICSVFNLQDTFEIFISDAHVPRTETAGIIAEGDVLRLEKVTNLLNVCEQSRNDNCEIQSPDIRPQKKKKKRKNLVDESGESEKLTDKDTSEVQSSSFTFSSSPNEKKRKKNHDDASQDYFGETSREAKTRKCETKVKRESHDSSKEWPQHDLLRNIGCGGIVSRDEVEDDVELMGQNASKTQSSNVASVAPPKKGRRKKCDDEAQDCSDETSCGTNERNSGKIRMESNGSCYERPWDDLLNKKICNGNKNLKNHFDVLRSHKKGNTDRLNNLSTIHHCRSESENLSPSDQVNSFKPANTLESERKCDTMSESLECSFGSSSSQKKKRKRKRKRSNRGQDTKKLPVHETEVIADAPILPVATKRMKNMINNCHIRFSDAEEIESVNEVPGNGMQMVECRSASSNMVSVDSNACKNVIVDLIETSNECPMSGPIKDHQGPDQKSDDASDDHVKDHQKVLDVSHAMKCEFSNVENFDTISENGMLELVKNDDGVESIVSKNENVSCEKKVSSEDHTSNTVWSRLGPPCSRGNRRRNAVIAMGLGATLSQLMKDSNSTNNIESIPPKEVPIETPQVVDIPKPKQIEENPKKDIKERYSGYPILEKLPQILKLNERYEPTISGHLKGKVMECEEDTKQVTVDILGGDQELAKTCGKFDLIDGDEETDVVKKPSSGGKNGRKTLQLNWNEFIEPRIMFP